MSDLRIALVAEGPTDRIILEKALEAVLKERSFVLQQLQSENLKPKLGGGWCGALRWCQAARTRHRGPLDDDPTLQTFDLVILHLDADVAGKKYADCGPSLEEQARKHSWGPLPCSRPCPPASQSAAALGFVLRSWLGGATPGEKTLLWLPKKDRIRKSTRAYTEKAPEIAANWPRVKSLCPLAQQFEDDVRGRLSLIRGE